LHKHSHLLDGLKQIEIIDEGKTMFIFSLHGKLTRYTLDGENVISVTYRLPGLEGRLIWHQDSFYFHHQGEIVKGTFREEEKWLEKPNFRGIQTEVEKIMPIVHQEKLICASDREVFHFTLERLTESQPQAEEKLMSKLKEIQHYEELIRNEIYSQQSLNENLEGIAEGLLLKEKLKDVKIQANGRICATSVLVGVYIIFAEDVEIPTKSTILYLVINKPRVDGFNPIVLPFWTSQTNTNKFTFEFTQPANDWIIHDQFFSLDLHSTPNSNALFSFGTFSIDLLTLSQTFILCPLGESPRDLAERGNIISFTIFIGEHMLKDKKEIFIKKVLSKQLHKSAQTKVWISTLPLGNRVRIKGFTQTHNRINGVEFVTQIWCHKKDQRLLTRVKASLLRRIVEELRVSNISYPNASAGLDEILESLREHTANEDFKQNKSQILELRSRIEHPNANTNVENLEKELNELLQSLKVNVLNDNRILYVV